MNILAGLAEYACVTILVCLNFYTFLEKKKKINRKYIMRILKSDQSKKTFLKVKKKAILLHTHSAFHTLKNPSILQNTSLLCTPSKYYSSSAIAGEHKASRSAEQRNCTLFLVPGFISLSKDNCASLACSSE